jgi:ABC-2 type transport system ATP-binding protein
MSAIETSQVSKRYGHTWALRDCTLAIPAGRVVALVGPNGAGKTTLLHLAVGLTAPTSGGISVLGNLTPGSDEALSRVGFVAQDTPLYPGLRVAETIRLVGSLSDRWDESDARRRLAALGIPLDRRVGRLSGGQRAQVALAVALARRPELLVLDEPVARLDPLARHEFMSTLMAAVAEDGISVVFSSHVVGELERICDYLVVLSQGKLQVNGDVDTLLESHQVLTGPTAQADAVASSMPVVWAMAAGRQSRLLVRASPHAELPDGWQKESTNLEELVLAYLRAPDATAFSGPQPGGYLTAQRVPV